MQITRNPGESDQAFRARAFEANRNYSATPKTAEPLNIRLQAVQFAKHSPFMIVEAPSGATPVSFAELHAKGVPLAFGPTVAMSRNRAIWYGAGLVFGAVLIAMAVFGMVR